MMDMRRAAYGYLGDAIGMCLALGLNRKHDASRISHAEFTHRSKLFWTAYVLDRKLSSLIGVPPRLHDEDIGLTRPSLVTATNTSEMIMAFHIDLSSQLGDVLQVVLILVDVLLPSSQSWDPSKTFKIMDDMALRECVIVGPYKQDLVEIDNFRQRVRATADVHEETDAPTGPHGPVSTTASVARHDINGGPVSEQHVVFESALEFLNCSFPDYLPPSELDPFAWVWGDDRE
ncbi:hypothetical protein KJ359_001039 [Pestalotiopsis sp. 9143b]|nr:hypothetical protein KJ359_001039 [Pestalotiopsis sp. 9143b]